MTVKPSTLYILTIIILAIILAGVFYLVKNYDPKTSLSDTDKKLKVELLSKRAGTYYSRLRYYSGVCKDIGVTPDFKCHESETSYALEIQLSDNSFYCTDSNGFIGATKYSKGINTHCMK